MSNTIPVTATPRNWQPEARTVDMEWLREMAGTCIAPGVAQRWPTLRITRWLGLVLAVLAPVSIEASGHDACNDCHISTPAVVRAKRSVGPSSFRLVSVSSSGMCLGCHDGTNGRMLGGHTPSGGQHPVDVEYRYEPGLRGGLRAPFSTPSGLGGSIMEDLLVDGRIECVSCHDPHAATRGQLVMSNAGSQLCLVCHEK